MASLDENGVFLDGTGAVHDENGASRRKWRPTGGNGASPAEMAPHRRKWRLTGRNGASQMQMALTLASEETADNGTKIEAIISVQMGNML